MEVLAWPLSPSLCLSNFWCFIFENYYIAHQEASFQMRPLRGFFMCSLVWAEPRASPQRKLALVLLRLCLLLFSSRRVSRLKTAQSVLELNLSSLGPTGNSGILPSRGARHFAVVSGHRSSCTPVVSLLRISESLVAGQKSVQKTGQAEPSPFLRLCPTPLCSPSQLELLEVRRQQEEEERKRRPPSPEPSTKVSEETESQQQW